MNDAKTIEVGRQTIQYFPTSTTEVNSKRLPLTERMRSMALAFREDLRPRKEMESEATRRMSIVLLLLPSACFSAPIAVDVLRSLIQWVQPPQEFVWVVGGMGGPLILLSGIAALALLGGRSGLKAGLAVAAPLTLAVTAAALPLSARSIICTGAGAASLALFWCVAAEPLRFYRAWFLTDPRFSNPLRTKWEEQLREKKLPRLNRFAVVAALVSLPTAALFSPWLGLGLQVCICVGLTGSWRAYRQQVRSAAKLFSPFISYSAGTTTAPGAWTPAAPRSQRCLRLIWPLSLLSAATAIAGVGPDDLKLEGATVFLGLLVVSSTGLLTFALFRDILRASDSFRKDVDEDLRVQPLNPGWENTVDRLQSSTHSARDSFGNEVREAEHLFMGFEPQQYFPILLDRQLLLEHCYIVGRAGAGKTSLGIMPLLIQLIRGYQTPSGRSAPVPIVVLDLKGDPALFHTVKAEAERRGQQFRFFTTEKALASYRFNPFRGLRSESRTLPQLVQLVLDSLNLNHGQGYGRQYYSQRSRMLLSQALQLSPPPETFLELYKAVMKLAQSDKKGFHDAFELIATIETLTHYPQLITTPGQELTNPEKVIHLPNVIENSDVVYFWLPAALESISIREIGKLVLFNLHTAAMDRQRHGHTKQVYLFVDEFQKLAGENLQGILQQARSHGIAAILANQSIRDLRQPDFDLGPTVRTNTRVKLYFSLSDPDEVRGLSYMSGEEIQFLPDNEEESFKPRLTVNDILAVSDHPLQYILQVVQGSGYTQFGGFPVPVQTWWPLTKETYAKRSRAPWPSQPVLEEPKSSSITPPPTETSSRRAAKKQDQFIASLFNE